MSARYWNFFFGTVPHKILYWKILDTDSDTAGKNWDTSEGMKLLKLLTVANTLHFNQRVAAWLTATATVNFLLTVTHMLPFSLSWPHMLLVCVCVYVCVSREMTEWECTCYLRIVTLEIQHWKGFKYSECMSIEKSASVFIFSRTVFVSNCG